MYRRVASPYDQLTYAKELGIPVHSAAEEWARKTVVVFGNGHSSLNVDLDQLRSNRKVVSVICNSGMDLFPDADTLICTDRHWLHDNQDQLDRYKGPEIIVTRSEVLSVVDPRMKFMQRRLVFKTDEDIFRHKDLLVEGYTSVSTAISLAVLRGSKKIILVGVDLTPGPDGRRRAIGPDHDHPERARQRYKVQIAHLNLQSKWVKAHHVKVFNCGHRSDLVCYPYAELENVL